jgi:hypothetical protein
MVRLKTLFWRVIMIFVIVWMMRCRFVIIDSWKWRICWFVVIDRRSGEVVVIFLSTIEWKLGIKFFYYICTTFTVRFIIISVFMRRSIEWPIIWMLSMR